MVLGGTLCRMVECEYGTAAVTRIWEAPFDEVAAQSATDSRPVARN